MLKDFLKDFYGIYHIGKYLRMLYLKEILKYIDLTSRSEEHTSELQSH